MPTGRGLSVQRGLLRSKSPCVRRDHKSMTLQRVLGRSPAETSCQEGSLSGQSRWRHPELEDKMAALVGRDPPLSPHINVSALPAPSCLKRARGKPRGSLPGPEPRPALAGNPPDGPPPREKATCSRRPPHGALPWTVSRARLAGDRTSDGRALTTGSVPLGQFDKRPPPPTTGLSLPSLTPPSL